jgi:hypothetical protein
VDDVHALAAGASADTGELKAILINHTRLINSWGEQLNGRIDRLESEVGHVRADVDHIGADVGHIRLTLGDLATGQAHIVALLGQIADQDTSQVSISALRSGA